MDEVKIIYLNGLNDKNATYEIKINKEIYETYLNDIMKDIEAKETTNYEYKQNRKHKKRRINKKWITKYGVHMSKEVVMEKEIRINVNDYPNGRIGDGAITFSIVNK